MNNVNFNDLYVTIHLNPPLPFPFSDIYIQVDTDPPHLIRYYVRIYGHTAKMVTKQYFSEILDLV